MTVLQVVERFGDTVLSVDELEVPPLAAPIGASYQAARGDHTVEVTVLSGPAPRWTARASSVDPRLLVALGGAAVAHALLLLFLPAIELEPPALSTDAPPPAPYVVTRAPEEKPQPWVCEPGVPGDEHKNTEPQNQEKGGSALLHVRVQTLPGDLAVNPGADDGCDDFGLAEKLAVDLGEPLDMDDVLAPAPSGELEGGFGYGLGGGGGGGRGWGTIGVGHDSRIEVEPVKLTPGGRRPCPVRQARSAPARAAAPVRARVRMRAVGEQDADVARRARRALPAVQRCVDAGGSSAQASMSVGFAISPDGRVQGARATGAADAALGDCVAAAFAAVEFARPDAGVLVVRYDLTLGRDPR